MAFILDELDHDTIHYINYLYLVKHLSFRTIVEALPAGPSGEKHNLIEIREDFQYLNPSADKNAPYANQSANVWYNYRTALDNEEDPDEADEEQAKTYNERLKAALGQEY
ncbi:MAG: hypothetical protein Q9166_005296 [cf. Caloplaca sp. 2 TL-2023]